LHYASLARFGTIWSLTTCRVQSLHTPKLVILAGQAGCTPPNRYILQAAGVSKSNTRRVDNPALATAMGGAEYAFLHASTNPRKPAFRSVVAHDIGIQVYNAERKMHFVEPVLYSTTPLPAFGLTGGNSFVFSPVALDDLSLLVMEVFRDYRANVGIPASSAACIARCV
jgi:hypothetical protein